MELAILESIWYIALQKAFFALFSQNKSVCSYYLLFADPPAIALSPLNATKEEGENFTWFCGASGNPEPNISWIFNGSHINTNYNPNIVFSKDKRKLTITNVSRKYSGEYQCLASNNIGNASSQVATFDVLCEYDVSWERQSCNCITWKEIILRSKEWTHWNYGWLQIIYSQNQTFKSKVIKWCRLGEVRLGMVWLSSLLLTTRKFWILVKPQQILHHTYAKTLLLFTIHKKPQTNVECFLLQTYQRSLLIRTMWLKKKEKMSPYFVTLWGIRYQKYHGIREDHLLVTAPGLICRRITNTLL